MKRLFYLILCCGLWLTGHAQTLRGDNRVIEPDKIEVSYSQTVHLLFPSAVSYVDLGSADLLADRVSGLSNVVRIKAATPDFPEKSTCTVITEDGRFYSFIVTYAEQPARLSIEIDKSAAPAPEDRPSAPVILQSELNDANPHTVTRLLAAIHKADRSDLRTIGARRYGIVIWLKGIYIHDDLLLLHLSVTNRSALAYDVDLLRFAIADKRTAKRTAHQVATVEPVRTWCDLQRIGPGATVRNVYALQKFTIPDKKTLTVELTERGGGRHLSFRIENRDILNARPLKPKTE